MPFRFSLRKRIIIAFCSFGTVLGSVYAFVVYISLDALDDHLIDSRLKEEVEYFDAYYQQYKIYPQPTSPYFTTFVGTENMPPDIQNIINVYTEGLHEVYIDEDEYHIAIQKLIGHDEILYMLYNVSALEFTEKRKIGIRSVLIAGVALIIGLGFFIGWLTSHKVITPVTHLADLVRKSGPDNLPKNFSKIYLDDEIGVLAKALEQAMQRVEAHVEREYRFNLYASHELRTPVTIIKGAVGLLKRKLPYEKDPAYRPLNRIERAVTNMENIIGTLLWLSREDKATDQRKAFDVVSLARETIEQNRNLVVDKPFDIELVPENNPQLSIPAPIFQIMLTNLIRNAIQHTASGNIRVVVYNDCVCVSDTGAGMDPDELNLVARSQLSTDRHKGFGLGLSIVRRLCDRLGWKLKIESEKGNGTNVQLIFSSVEV